MPWNKLDFLSSKNLRQPQLNLSIFLIFLSRIITFVAFPKASLLPDSGSYASEKFPDFSLVSFMGHAMRGWPTPLLFSLLPNNSLRILALLLISAFAWTYFARTVLSISSTSISKWLIFTLLISISCSPNLIQWDTSILGQSLLNSNYVIVASLLIRFMMKETSSKIATILFGFTLLLSLQKSINFFTLLVVIFIIIIKRSKLQKGWTRTCLGVFIILGTTYGAVVGVSVDNFWKGGTYSGKALLWHLGGQSPAAPDFKNYLSERTNAPLCIYSNAPYSNIDTEMSKIFQSCIGAEFYLSRQIKKDFLDFLIANPKDVFKLESIGFGAALTGSSSNYGSAVGILPQSLYQITQGGVTPDFRFSKSQDQVQAFNILKTGEPIWITSPGILWVFSLFSIWIYRLKRGRIEDIERTFITLTSLLILQSAITFLIIPSEWVRSTAAYIPLLVLLSAIYVVIQFPNMRQIEKDLD